MRFKIKNRRGLILFFIWMVGCLRNHSIKTEVIAGIIRSIESLPRCLSQSLFSSRLGSILPWVHASCNSPWVSLCEWQVGASWELEVTEDRSHSPKTSDGVFSSYARIYSILLAVLCMNHMYLFMFFCNYSKLCLLDICSLSISSREQAPLICWLWRLSKGRQGESSKPFTMD